jgi:UDP-N-acetylmuramyl pentapeptide phosphotransferase/UDP-N-acetylglucosamine-1-phosphate transferase
MTLAATTLLSLAVFIAVLVLTGLVRNALRRRSILDHPNERSSHEIPTPRGGGWGLIPIVILGWLVVGHLDALPLGTVLLPCGLALALGALSWWDDLGGLSPVVRLLGQGAAVAVVLILLPAPGGYFGGLLPPALDPVAAGLLWVWYINLFNFMDGIDGISAVETACTGAGIAVVTMIAGFDAPFAGLGFVLTAGALGFLLWNWQPAKIFLGDIGSVPLGFLLGWLLLSLAASGQWAAALILPAYYLADATITLFRRTLRGEKVWRPHRQHFYQRAVQKGAGHARVSLAILFANILLIGLAALAALGRTGLALAGAALVVAGLLAFLNGGAGARREAG